jgi:hypothetical protein
MALERPPRVVQRSLQCQVALGQGVIRLHQRDEIILSAAQDPSTTSTNRHEQQERAKADVPTVTILAHRFYEVDIYPPHLQHGVHYGGSRNTT